MKSVWINDSQLPQFPSLKNDIKTDVLIIGGGIAGILTAYFLHQKGINYVLVEKDKICSHTTQNTTAKITFQHGLIYHKILKQSGIETAKAYLHANKLALEEFKNMCKNIDCDFEIQDNYVYSTANKKILEAEMNALYRIGFDAEFCNNIPLPLDTVGAVKFANQAQFNPLKFISAISKNLNIYEHTFVKEMIDTTAVTDFGKIKAKKIIVATHFPFINKHGSYFVKLYQHRSYAIALENAEKVDGMYVSENEKGLSFRHYKNYLILGGGSHRTGKFGGTQNELRDFAKTHYPHSHEKFCWATQDCMSLDGMPYIGQYSKSTPKLFVASGFNKWGMTSSMMSAMILSDLIDEKENAFSNYFNPSRSILKPQLFVNAFESTKNLLTISSKRCPHLGCALKWNKNEHSWDCPCHGSRFSENGKLLDNPANNDINKS